MTCETLYWGSVHKIWLDRGMMRDANKCPMNSKKEGDEKNSAGQAATLEAKDACRCLGLKLCTGNAKDCQEIAV